MLTLRIFQNKDANDAFGIVIEQHTSSGRTRTIVSASGYPLRACIDRVLDTLRSSGYKASDLDPRRVEPFTLDEPAGVRLALLLMAVKPLRKVLRIDDVAHGIREMSDEECYYWFSKCADRRDGQRALRALRVLLAV